MFRCRGFTYEGLLEVFGNDLLENNSDEAKIVFIKLSLKIDTVPSTDILDEIEQALANKTITKNRTFVLGVEYKTEICKLIATYYKTLGFTIPYPLETGVGYEFYNIPITITNDSTITLATNKARGFCHKLRNEREGK